MRTHDGRYPVGRYSPPQHISDAQRTEWIQEIAALPAALRGAVEPLTPAQLATPYRTGGWTVQQVVHHIPDSHMQAYARFKLALTEDEPMVKPYDEAAWAELADAREVPVGVSLSLLDALHSRWVALLRTLGAADFRRGYRHPEHARVLTLEYVLGMYAWHGRHHLAQVTSLAERSGW